MGGFPGRREDWRVRRSRPSAQNRSACAPTIPAQSHTSKAAAIPNTPAGPSAIGEPTPGRATGSAARPQRRRGSTPGRWPGHRVPAGRAPRPGLRRARHQRPRPRVRWRLSRKSYFLNIKGPELLNKYVGETERHIRLVFQRAREKASEGMPVVVFFDEMDSIFRTRGFRAGPRRQTEHAGPGWPARSRRLRRRAKDIFSKYLLTGCVTR